MGKPRSKRPYAGELLQPIRLPPHHGSLTFLDPSFPRLVSSSDLRREEALVERETNRKLFILLEHHRIDPKSARCWFDLARALAREGVPGFKTLRSPGPPRSESVALYATVYRSFIRLKCQMQRTRSRFAGKLFDKAVCQRMKKDDSFNVAAPQLKSASIKRLQNLVSRAKACRKARLGALVDQWARTRRMEQAGIDDVIGHVGGDMPYWWPPLPGQMTSMARKYAGKPKKSSRKRG